MTVVMGCGRIKMPSPECLINKKSLEKKRKMGQKKILGEKISSVLNMLGSMC